MITLDAFDFDGTCDETWVPDHRELPPEHIELLANLEQASAENNLFAVKQGFESLRRTHANPEILVRSSPTIYGCILFGMTAHYFSGTFLI